VLSWAVERLLNLVDMAPASDRITVRIRRVSHLNCLVFGEANLSVASVYGLAAL